MKLARDSNYPSSSVMTRGLTVTMPPWPLIAKTRHTTGTGILYWLIFVAVTNLTALHLGRFLTFAIWSHIGGFTFPELVFN